MPTQNKAHIFNEISRTVTANGGVTLGEARFGAETGTKRTEMNRILSPVRLPYSSYWKHVAVVLKVCESKARTSPPWCFRIVAAWG